MKKQIILRGPIKLSFGGVKSQQKVPKAIRNQPPVKSRLDRPPDPTVLQKALKAKAPLSAVGTQPNRLRRILIVEDEDNLRHFYLSVLARAGYYVNAAEDGEAGWQAVQAAGFASDAYDLLITDNKMPRLTGVELIEKVHSARPELPIILASAALPVDTESLPVAAIIPKPFFMGDLLQIVRNILKEE